MMKNRIKERAKKVPAEIKRMVSRSMATAKYINKILQKQGKTQREFAELLGKKESEISKWLTGTHNFTYKTIGKIEIVLGEPIIIMPDEAIQNIYLLNPIKAGAEQTICIPASKDSGYTSFEKGKKQNMQKSATITKSTTTTDKFQIFECAN